MVELSSMIMIDLAKGEITIPRAHAGARFVDGVLDQDELRTGQSWVHFVSGKRPGSRDSYPSVA